MTETCVPGTVLPASADTTATSVAMARAQLYHFFELALAHPAPDGVAVFRARTTQHACDAALRRAFTEGEAWGAAADSASRFFAALQSHDDAQVEAAHIALFSAGFPTLPCPPYGSLFTVQGDKRLEAMRQIKAFYQREGFDLNEDFTDLPDHLCVELEFMQALCFVEHDAETAGDGMAAARSRSAQAEFLDEFLLPFARGIANAARVQKTPNLYADVLAAVAACAEGHRNALATAAGARVTARLQ